MFDAQFGRRQNSRWHPPCKLGRWTKCLECSRWQPDGSVGLSTCLWDLQREHFWPLVVFFPQRRLRCQQLDASGFVHKMFVDAQFGRRQGSRLLHAIQEFDQIIGLAVSQSESWGGLLKPFIILSLFFSLLFVCGGCGVRLALPEWSGKYMTDKGSNVNRAMIVGSDIAAKPAGFQIIGSDQEASAISLVALNLTWEKQGGWIAAFLLQFPAWCIRDQGV